MEESYTCSSSKATQEAIIAKNSRLQPIVYEFKERTQIEGHQNEDQAEVHESNTASSSSNSSLSCGAFMIIKPSLASFNSLNFSRNYFDMNGVPRTANPMGLKLLFVEETGRRLTLANRHSEIRSKHLHLLFY